MFRKMKCPRCGKTATKYLDKVIRETPHGSRYEKVYWCRICEKTFNLPIEMPYGSRLMKR